MWRLFASTNERSHCGGSLAEQTAEWLAMSTQTMQQYAFTRIDALKQHSNFLYLNYSMSNQHTPAHVRVRLWYTFPDTERCQSVQIHNKVGLLIAATRNTPSATASTSRSRHSSTRDVTRRFRDALDVRRRSVTSQQKPRARQPPADPDNESGSAVSPSGSHTQVRFTPIPRRPVLCYRKFHTSFQSRANYLRWSPWNPAHAPALRPTQPTPQLYSISVLSHFLILCLNSGWSHDC